MPGIPFLNLLRLVFFFFLGGGRGREKGGWVFSSSSFSKVKRSMTKVEERCGFDVLVKESERKLNISPLRVCPTEEMGD